MFSLKETGCLKPYFAISLAWLDPVSVMKNTLESSSRKLVRSTVDNSSIVKREDQNLTRNNLRSNLHRGE